MDQIWYVINDMWHVIYIRYMLCSASCFANVCEANVFSCTQSNVELQIKRVFCVCRAAAPRTQDSKNNAPVWCAVKLANLAWWYGSTKHSCWGSCRFWWQTRSAARTNHCSNFSELGWWCLMLWFCWCNKRSLMFFRRRSLHHKTARDHLQGS